LKSLILAAPTALLYVALVTAVFRIRRVRRRAAAMLWTWLMTIPVFVSLHVLTPADLDVLPPALTEPAAAVELAFGLFLNAAIFLGGFLQIYNLADRGLSLRALTDIAEAGRPLTVDEVARAYAGGRSLQWMYEKRLHGLVEQRLVRVDDGLVAITERGKRAARLFARLRAVLAVDR
jgi:hypothetical protein